ncbi:MAG: uracil-DNA glycosylase [Saccharolobus sp.]|uniref:uracil-DNA glycosylase n=1 Tax=Saccharolobus sp. TaxID=2100761 RepID=UPI00316F2132
MVEECRKCPLWKNRNKSVFGEGPPDAKIMLIGLGPGYHEDREGRPFVGAAGKFLNKLLESAGLKREEVYITNVIKCYLPENKVTEEEFEACTPYLDKQIEIIDPDHIIALGNTAAEYVSRKFKIPFSSMERAHGSTFKISTIIKELRITFMYHPAAGLRNPPLRNVIEEDWRKLFSYIF